MRVMVTSVFLWAFLLAARIDARPQELGTMKVIRADMAKEKNVSDAWNNSTTTLTSTKPKDVGSRVEPSNAERDLKDYQYMDNSLRTVATQLFNVSSVKEEPNIEDNTMLDKVESRLGLLIHKADDSIREILFERDHFNDNIKSDTASIESVDVGFDRSTNSKYNYLKTSHPGEAMALTEEDLERELVLTKLMTSHKKKPTTTGGISTWILLNPPSTTVKSLMSDKAKDTHNKRENTKKTTLSLKPTVSTANINTATTANLTTPMMLKNSPTRAAPVKSINTIKQSSTTLKMEKLTSQMVPPHTTPRPETTKKIFDGALRRTTPRNEDSDLTTLKVTTKRTVSSSRAPKPVITTPKTTTVISQSTTIKIAKPNNSNQSTKSNVIRKVTSKPESTKNSLNATSKIEKVTFKPVQMITTPKSTVQHSVPTFITKLQASLNRGSESNNSSASTAFIESVPIGDIPKTNITYTKRVQAVFKPKPSKPNNVLNVQLKKPVDTRTRIEIQPIKVNTPVLTIEKVEEENKDIEINGDKPIAMGDSKIDVKFVFNPELTKIVETPMKNTATTVETSTITSTTTSTTKRPKQKRKKNKTRRRKPSSSTTSNPITTLATAVIDTVSNNIDANQQSADNAAIETSLQESKIVPDSDASSHNTKNKKKQVQKPITSQIYSFLSREVMPSVGVMSLVGLGLGLASYFLYPFGGTIARRNYEIEPNYKYNLNEYGGNYGQSEEEVFSKVLQGMTTSNVNYGGMKDYENNYYRYQAYDGAYADPSYSKRKGDIRYSATSSVPIYRPDNSPLTYTSKYRKNEFQYPVLSTTPKYYERHAESEFVINQGSADRQFVVGNIPKGYSYEKDQSLSKLSTTTESTQTDFEKQIAQSLKFVENPVHSPPNFEQPEAQALKANEGYEEIEIAPTAVAVEHGPRALKLEKHDGTVQETSNNKNVVKMRRKRDSSIQQIPTRSEMEEMENEEELSNEILDIIDSTVLSIPPEMVEKNVKNETQDDKTGKPTLASSTSSTLRTTSEPKKNTVEDGKNTSTTIQSIMTSKEYFNTEIDLPTTSKNFPTSDETIVTTANSLESAKTSSSKTSNPDIIVTIGGSENTTASSETTICNNTTTAAPLPERFNFLKFVKQVAEIKLRVGLSVLKHASENFAKYLGNVQKKLNGGE